MGVIPQRGRLLMERTGCVLDVLPLLAGCAQVRLTDVDVFGEGCMRELMC